MRQQPPKVYAQLPFCFTGLEWRVAGQTPIQTPAASLPLFSPWKSSPCLGPANRAPCESPGAGVETAPGRTWLGSTQQVEYANRHLKDDEDELYAAWRLHVALLCGRGAMGGMPVLSRSLQSCVQGGLAVKPLGLNPLWMDPLLHKGPRSAHTPDVVCCPVATHQKPLRVSAL